MVNWNVFSTQSSSARFSATVWSCFRVNTGLKNTLLFPGCIRAIHFLSVSMTSSTPVCLVMSVMFSIKRSTSVLSFMTVVMVGWEGAGFMV